MAYDLNRRLFIENGPAIHAAEGLARSSAAWRSLNPGHRLALIDEALRNPANDDCIDGYPAAL